MARRSGRLQRRLSITTSALILIHPSRCGDVEISDEFCTIDMALLPLLFSVSLGEIGGGR